MASIANYIKGLIRDRNLLQNVVSNLKGTTVTNKTFTELGDMFENSYFQATTAQIPNMKFVNCPVMNTEDLRAFVSCPFHTNLAYTFKNLRSTSNLTGIENLKTNNVTDISSMFENSMVANLDLSKWNTSKITNASGFMVRAYVQNLNLHGWNLSNMTSGFDDLVPTYRLNILDMSDMKLPGGGKNFQKMFIETSSTLQYNLQNWSFIGAGINLANIFTNVSFMRNTEDLRSWKNTIQISDLQYAFDNCVNLNNIDGLGAWSLQSCTNLQGMFNSCKKINNINGLSTWNLYQVKNMAMMFQNCQNINGVINFNNFSWNTRVVNNMYNLFRGCYNITAVDFAGLKTNNVTDMANMFYYCQNLTTLNNMSSLNATSVINIGKMFYYCNNLTNAALTNLAYFCLNARNVTYKNLSNANSYSPLYGGNKQINSSTVGSSLISSLTSAGWTGIS